MPEDGYLSCSNCADLLYIFESDMEENEQTPKLTYKGKVWYFCNEYCLNAYVQDQYEMKREEDTSFG